MAELDAKNLDSTGVDVAILGAGIAGLIAGTLLQRAGVTVGLVDKGRGVGGRMSTRRSEDGVFDHGAQYFTVRTEAFQHFVDEWLDAGVVREWFRHLDHETGSTGHPRYIGIGGMSAVPKAMAAPLPVQTDTKVVAIEWDGETWKLRDLNGGMVLKGRYLLITAPLPQAFALVEGALPRAIDATEASRFRNFSYRRSLTAMVRYSEGTAIGGFGGRKHSHPDLLWVADNHLKGISPVPGAVTLHSSYEFGDRYWDADPADWSQLLIEAAGDCCPGSVVSVQTHRWRFNLPERPIEEGVHLKRREHLVLAGDAFGGPRVEGSVLSGIAAAEKLLELL